MDVQFWGPNQWGFLSVCALNYPESNPSAKQQAIAKLYLRSLMEILPCKWCRLSSLEYIKDLPPEPFLHDRAGFCYWVYRFHMKVNDKLGKNNCSFRQFIAKYEKYRAKCAKKDGLGCTEPLPEKCEEEVSAWCDNAWTKYSSSERQRVTNFHREQLIVAAVKYGLIIVLVMLIVWLAWPRFKNLAKRAKISR